MEKTKDEDVVNLQELALARKRNRSRFTDEPYFRRVFIWIIQI